MFHFNINALLKKRNMLEKRREKKTIERDQNNTLKEKEEEK